MFYKSLNGKCRFHLVVSCIVLAGCSFCPSLDADTILYNGIQLPDQWPPRTGNPNSLSQMWSSLPKVIEDITGNKIHQDAKIDSLFHKTFFKFN